MNIPVRDGVIYRELTEIPICCVVPVGHPYAQKNEVNEKELLSENIIICNSYEIPSKAPTFKIGWQTNSCRILPITVKICR